MTYKYFTSMMLGICCFGQLLNAQAEKNLSIAFKVTIENSPIQASDMFYASTPTDSFQIEALKFYVSKIEFLNQTKLVFEEANSFHLIDFDKSGKQRLNLKVPKNLEFSHIKFNLGIDSLTNVAGAHGGDLDPMYGMYWAWQSGYINFKLEGIASNVPTKKNQFIFHLGGFLGEFSNMQTITLKVNNLDNLDINFPLDEFISQIDLRANNHIMSPGEKSLSLAKLAASLFTTAYEN